MPVRVTFCVLDPALSVMKSELVVDPAVVGVKVTFIVQFLPGFTIEPQLLVWANGAAAEIFVMPRIPRPVLVSVTVWAVLVVNTTWVLKVRLPAESVTAGSTPTPVSETDCGLFEALSVRVTAAVRVPVVIGVKVTLIVQLPPTGRDIPQVLV